jgi:hypothetical protein
MATTSLTTPTSAATGNIPFVGSTANDSTGTTIRESFTRINARLGEIYGSQNSSNVVQTPFVDADNIKASAINEAHLQISNDPSTDQILKWDGSTGFTWIDQFNGDITGIVAGGGLTGDATSGDATLAVGAGTGITVNTNDIAVDASAVDHDALSNFVGNEHIDHSTVTVTAGTGLTGGGDITATRTLNVIGGTGITANANDIQISDNGVDHDQLAARFTESKTDYGNISTDTTIDWSVAAIHQISMTGAATLNFNNYKKGQAVDLLITGNQTITFGTVSGTPSINQVGSSTYDGTKDNIIQVLCTDDDATPTFLFAVGDYTTDTNPA